MSMVASGSSAVHVLAQGSAASCLGHRREWRGVSSRRGLKCLRRLGASQILCFFFEERDSEKEVMIMVDACSTTLFKAMPTGTPRCDFRGRDLRVKIELIPWFYAGGAVAFV